MTSSRRINIVVDNKYNFISIFEPDSGFYYRTPVIKKNMIPGVVKTIKVLGFPQCVKFLTAHTKVFGENQSPFMGSMPALLDIGVMGRCNNPNRCKICYQASSMTGSNMHLRDYKSIIDQIKGTAVNQVALGGAGNPTDHNSFEEICRYTAEAGIVPNYTVSGHGFTKRHAKISADYCGVSAVSAYSMLNRL